MRHKWVVRDAGNLGLYFMSEDEEHECFWVGRLKFARRYYMKAHAEAAAAKWEGVVVRLVPRRKPLTGPELAQKYGFKPHGRKSGA